MNTETPKRLVIRKNIRLRQRRACHERPGRSELKAQLVYYGLVFLKVALWVAIALALSHLHMGGPCFVVALLLWVYSEPLKTLFSRARRKVRQFSAAEPQVPRSRLL